MKKLAVIGSGDLGKQIVQLALESNDYIISGFFDDFETIGNLVHGYPILGSIESIQQHFENRTFDELLIGIGYKHMEIRHRLFERFQYQIPFGKIIHTSCIIHNSVSIGSGSILYSGTHVDMGAKISENCLIYNGCIIAHDTQIASHTILSPGVKIAGFSKIESLVNLGIGTIISDNVTVAMGTKTGAGAVVVKDIDESGLYVGIPAKKIKS
jgi:sugar O-acyltransferase (sialic acid O-acetyltransferase NeuD family)